AALGLAKGFLRWPALIAATCKMPADRYQPKMPKNDGLIPLGRVLCRRGCGVDSARRGESAGGAATAAASGSGLDGVTYDLVKTNCSGVAADFLLSDPNSELARQRWAALPSPARQLSRQTGSAWLCKRSKWAVFGVSTGNTDFTRSVKSFI